MVIHKLLSLPDMLRKENGSEVKLTEYEQNNMKRKCEIRMQFFLFSIGLLQLELMPLVGFLFCSQSKQFNWLNTQCVQFYWNGGDLGAFSSKLLAD